PPADHQIKANMRNEAPEYSLGDREGQGDEDYSQKRRKTFLDFDEVDLRNAFEHRGADQHQYWRGCVRRHHARERGEKEAWEKAEGGENSRQSSAAADVDARNAFDVSRS